MLISIIIPVRNEEQIIKKTLCEFTNKLFKHFLDFEIIVVDDGSTDNTRQRIEKIVREDSRIRKPFTPHIHRRFSLGTACVLRKYIHNR